MKAKLYMLELLTFIVMKKSQLEISQKYAYDNKIDFRRRI